MAQRKKVQRRPPKRRTSPRPKPKAKAAKKPVAKKPVAKKPAAAASGMRRKVVHGMITHTELASADPAATQEWCESVLGWKFAMTVPTPTGPYHMWRFPNDTGGGLRAHQAQEAPGSIPYCEVRGIQTTYDEALKRGATGMLPPQMLPGGMGWIAIVSAPGGVTIGFWAEK